MTAFTGNVFSLRASDGLAASLSLSGDDLTITVSATDDGSVALVQFLQDNAPDKRAVAIERLMLRPLVNQDPIILFMATIGLTFFLEGLGKKS